MNDLVVLAALLRGPAYGYALKKTAGLIFGASAMHNNVVYPALRKFMRNGWVEQTTVQGERGQQRKEYRITSAGKKYLLEQLGTFGERHAAEDAAFLFRVALFDALPKAKREAILAARRSFLTARSAQLAELQETIQPTSFGAVALDRLQDQIKGELRWVREIGRRLQSDKGR